MTARERAYRGYRRAADVFGAARMAMWLASDHLDFRGDDAVAAAWLQRARALLRDATPCAEQGYITLLEADIALLAEVGSGERASGWRARRSSSRVTSTTPASRSSPSRSWGSALVASGAVGRGLRRLEECAALAVGEEFAETAAPGWALCHTVSACADVGDFGRADAVVPRAAHVVGGLAGAALLRRLPHGLWRGARDQRRLAVRRAGAAQRHGRPACHAPGARARRPPSGSAGCACDRATWPRRGRSSSRRSRCRRRSSPSASWILAGGDATAAADAADRVLRRPVRGEHPRPLPCPRAPRARPRRRGRHGRRGRGDRPSWQREAARLATPYMRGRARLVRARVCRLPVTTTARGRPPRMPPTSSPSARRRTRRRKHGWRCPRRSKRSGAPSVPRRRHVRHATPSRCSACAGSPGATAARSSARVRPTSSAWSPQGLADAQIAERLFLSPHTVHRHIANIRTKLDVPSRAAAVAHATRSGLL